VKRLFVYYIKKSSRSMPLFLIGLGLFTRFAFFGWPASAVFDEVHFGKFISAYFTHQYYFDIHPPLGKLILAGWGWLWGFKPGFSFGSIGDVYPDHLYMALRFLPSLAGALLPIVIYGIARQLGLRRRAAALAGVLIALDNALVIQSRLILLDSFLLLFGFSAVWCYLRSRSYPSYFLLLTSGLLGGMAMSIKWTGITFLALIAILEIIRLWQAGAYSVKRIAYSFVCLVLLPLTVYIGAFIAHFSLLYKSGTGDAFMTREFQHDLEGNPAAEDDSVRSLSMGDKILQINEEMYRSNQRLTAGHPYSSKWYTWPLMARPIYYWVKGTARIYLIGNPVVWWGSTAAILAILVNFLFIGLKKLDHTVAILSGAWLLNILPFIGISRVMFLYHYFTALIWAVLLLAYLADRQRWSNKSILWIILLAAAAFLFFAPLTYGLPLSEGSYNARAWLPSWR
jgi:dolichyl-phosphate-mannose-protein mannosyltransferase